MSSIISSSLTALTIFSSLLASAAAAPVAWNIPTTNTDVLSAYTAPLTNGGAVTLPVPSPLVLKVLTLGRGTQNYTCASSTAADTPVSIGASATLIDAGVMLPFVTLAEGQNLLNEFPAILLDITRAAIDNSAVTKAGVHYFNAAGVPTFDLSTSNNGLLVGAKIGDIKAPADSTQGPYGAVDWLALGAKVGAGSEKLGRVYRTTTASGMAPPTCEGQKATLEIDYAAQYFFYA